MQHFDHLGDDGEVFLWNVYPVVEGIDHLGTDLLAWIGREIGVGLKENLQATQ